MKTGIKSLQPEDYAEVSAELDTLNNALSYFRSKVPFAKIDAPDVLPNAHKMWEWARALHVIKEYYPNGATVLDIGSSCSLLGPALAYLGYSVTECDINSDYKVRQTILNPYLEVKLEWLTCGHGSLPDVMFDVITSISTLEHVDLRLESIAWEEMVSRLNPGGLLIITCDCSKEGGVPGNCIDLYTMEELKDRVELLKSLGMVTVGDEDYTYHGNQVSWAGKGWYSFASVIMRKGVSQ